MRKLAWGSKAWQDYLYWQRCTKLCGVNDPTSAKDANASSFKSGNPPNGLARECAPRESQDKKTLKRINRLIQDTLSNPFEGLGKPEPLKENLSGFWSRRIDETHRLVYVVDDNYLISFPFKFAMDD